MAKALNRAKVVYRICVSDCIIVYIHNVLPLIGRMGKYSNMQLTWKSLPLLIVTGYANDKVDMYGC